MEVFFNQCENQGCPNYAYRERDLNGEKVMLCYLHNYQSDQGEEGVALEFHQQQIFLAHIKNTSRNLKIYKSLMIQMLENLNSLIKNKTRAILKDISEKQLNVKILQKQVLNNQIFFSKTLKNIEKCSNLLINPKNFDISLVTSQIEEHFNQNFISPVQKVAVEAKIIKSENFIPATFLANYKLTQPYVPISKKLKILSKTDFFMSFVPEEKVFHFNPVELLYSKLPLVQDCLISNKYNLLITAHEENSIRFWDLQSFTETIIEDSNQKMKAAAKIVEIILINDEFLLIVGSNYFKSINLSTLATEKSYFHDLGEFYICRAFSDHSKLLLGNYDGEIILFDVQTFTKEKECKIRPGKPSKTITSLSISANFTCALVGDCDGKVYLWVLNGEKSLLSFHFHSKPVSLSCFSSNNQFFATYSNDGNIKIWNISQKFNIIHQFNAGKDCWALSFHQNSLLEGWVLVVTGEKKRFCWKLEKKMKGIEVQDSRLLKFE